MQYIIQEQLTALAHFLMVIALCGPAVVVGILWGFPLLADLIDQLIDSRTARKS